MVRARILPEGITAPICSGFSIHDLRKRTSSSRRGFFNARADDGNCMSGPAGTRGPRRVKNCTKRGIARRRYGKAESIRPITEEILDLGEEALGFRLGRTGGE